MWAPKSVLVHIPLFKFMHNHYHNKLIPPTFCRDWENILHIHSTKIKKYLIRFATNSMLTLHLHTSLDKLDARISFSSTFQELPIGTTINLDPSRAEDGRFYLRN